MDTEGRKQHVEELNRGGEEDNIPFDCPIKVEDDNVTEEETSLDPFVKTEDLDIVENDLKIEVEEIETVIKEEQERTSDGLALAVEVISELEERPAIKEVAAKAAAGTAEAVVQPSTSRGKGKGRMLEEADEWFRPSTPRKIPRPSPLGKNVDVQWVNRSSSVAASPSPSWGDSSPATQKSFTAENLERFFLEERQRRAQEEAGRAERCRRASAGLESAEQKATKYREVLAFIRGEEKGLRVRQEALRQQMRALDDREEALEKKRRATLSKLQLQDLIVARLKQIRYFKYEDI